MSPSACKKTTEVLSVVCSLRLKQLPQDVKALEEKIIEIVNQAGREFYGAVFAAYQQQWLEACRGISSATLADHRSSDALWSDSIAGAGGALPSRRSLSDLEQAVAT